MNYTIIKLCNSKTLRMEFSKGNGNLARAKLACSNNSSYKLIIPTSEENFFVETPMGSSDNADELTEEFNSLFNLAREELIKADALFNALMVWREYRYGKK